MSLTAPPPPDPADDVDRPPSRRFRIVFGIAMALIAVGYMWVWQVRTGRVVVPDPPVLAVAGVRSATADPAALARQLVVSFAGIPNLTVLATDSASAERAGAEQVLFADHRTDERGHQIELRRMDVAGDSLLHVYRVHGSTLDDAVYRMAVQIAMSFGLPRPAAPGAAAR